jgi:hypothetical protein
MLRYRVTLALLLAAILSWALSSPVEAVPQAFVSASGADFDLETIIGNDNCGPVWPCRTMRRALSVVDEGGEIVVASSGNYDQFTIRKSVSVVAAPGVHAVITAATGSNAVTVNTSTTGVVALRGLTLNGLGGVTGISVVSVGILDVEDCILNGFTGNAVAFVPPFAASPGPSPEARPRLRIRDTTVKNSGSDFASAVYISTDGHALIDRLRMDHNRHGLVVDSGRVTIRDSVAASQVVHAVWARALNNTVTLNIENCTIVGTQLGSGIVAGDPSTARDFLGIILVWNSTVTSNATGISAFPWNAPDIPNQTRVWVSNTTIALNQNGIVQSGRFVHVLSRGNNTLEGNGNDGIFTVGGISAK